MKRGKRPGSPKTGGRKKGSKNKRTRELLEKAEAGGQSAIDYMLEVMRDNKNDASLRLDAAKAVAPYLHARRAPEDKGGNTVPPMIYEHPDLRRAPEDTGREIQGHGRGAARILRAGYDLQVQTRASLLRRDSVPARH